MLSIADEATDVQSLKRELSEARARIREVEQQYRDEHTAYQRSERHAQGLRDELDYHYRMFGNEDLSAATKITLICTRRKVREMRLDDSTEMEISTSAISSDAGVSPDTVGRELKRLDEKVVEYRTWKERLASGSFKTHSYVRLLPIIETPEAIEMERKQGGYHPKCKVCGSEDLEVVTRVRCRHCNNIEWSWPPDSDMGEAPPEQEPLHILEQPQTVEPLVQPPVLAPSATQDAPENATAIETIVTVMQRYGVKYYPHMTCHCGSKLFHMSLGDWACSRCEPGNFWPDNYVAAIRAIYPGKVASHDNY